MDHHRKALQKYKKRKKGKDESTSASYKKQVLKTSDKFVSTPKDAEEQLDALRHSDPCLRLQLRPVEKANSNHHDGGVIVPDIRISSYDSTTEDGSGNNDASFLSNLLYPLPQSTFLSHCFRKKAVFIQSNNPHRASDISENYLENLNTQHIFAETSSDNVFLWLRQQQSDSSQETKKPSADERTNLNDNTMSNDKSSTSTQNPLKSVEISDAELAYQLHSTSNHASYCRAPPELEQRLVHLMLRDTGLGCGQYDPSGERINVLGRGEVEVFIGTKGHITDWHTDFQENFTIQLSGSKKWTIKQGEVKHPLRGTTPHYECSNDIIESQLKAARLSNPQFQFGNQDLESNAYGNEIEIIMKAGDVLYHPAGMWHKVETIDYGVSINISLMGMNYAKVVCSALEHLLVKKQEWRQVLCSTSSCQAENGIPSTSSSNGEGNGTDCCQPQDIVLNQMDTLLRDLPKIIENFRKSGGAKCIIPPSLRIPPAFEVADDIINSSSDGEESEQGDGNDDSNDSNSEVEMNDTDSNQEYERDEDDSLRAIDLTSFQGPSDFTYHRPSSTHKLVQNPLASLTKIQDITSYNRDLKGIDDGDRMSGNDDDKHYVLNVSFAGNEMHESAVRVVFRDDSTNGILDRCYHLQQKHEECKSDVRDFSDIIDQDPAPNLFFYGYLVWVAQFK